MSHNEVKRLLAQARDAKARRDAIERALEAGMPLHEIEALLDFIDQQPASEEPREPPNQETAE